MQNLFLSHYFPPEVNAPASRTFEHCKRWVQAGHQVTVITSFPNCPDGVVFGGYKNQWKQEEVIEGVRVIRVWTFIAPNSGFIKRISNYISYMKTSFWQGLFVKNVDVMVATSPQFFCGWAGVLLHWFKRVPFVLEIRDIWPESILEVGAMKKGMVIRILEWMEKVMYRSADRIVAVGEGYKQKIVSKNISPNKIDVVINGVDLNNFANAEVQKDDLREKYGVAKNAFLCSYAGTVGMAHGLEVVLEAAEMLKKQGREKEVFFWIAGEGARRKELQKQAESMGLKNVHFLGRLPKSDMPKVIATSNVNLVHLKKSDLFTTVIPSKIFECMAMNFPIVMGVEGESCDMVLQAGAGVKMEPGNPESLLLAIDEIKKRGEESFQARDYAAKNFDRNILAQKMQKILEDVSKSTSKA